MTDIPQQIAPPSILTQLGFTPVGSTRRRLFISSEGEQGTGKTRIFRTCPGPVAIVNFDHGLEGSAEFDVHGQRIQQITIDMPDFDEGAKTMTATEWATAKTSYQRFKLIVDSVIRSRTVRTLGIDTGTAAYNLAQMARFGRIAQVGEVPPGMWTSMQAEYENVFAPFETHDCNLIVTHRQGTKFKGLAGERELKGYKGMKFASQVHLVYNKRVTRNADGTLEHALSVEVSKCRQRMALEGHRFDVCWLNAEKTESIGARFVDIAMAVFPNTSEQNWI